MPLPSVFHGFRGPRPIHRRGGGAERWFNVADCAPAIKRNSFFCVNFQFCCCLCAQPLCAILRPSLNSTSTPLFFFSLSSGRVDYVAKEIFLFLFFLFFAFFTVSHWFGVNAFWMPLGVRRAQGEEGAQGLAEWRNFNLKRVGGGPCGLRPKERHSSENWSGFQSQETSETAPPASLLPHLFFRVTPPLAAHRCTVSLFFPYPKTNPWVKQTYFSPQWENRVYVSQLLHETLQIYYCSCGSGLVGFFTFGTTNKPRLNIFFLNK